MTNPIQPNPSRSKKWRCDLCGEIFKTKKALVEHVGDELENAAYEESITQGQLEDLGVKPYEI